ncbi:MAG: hypothetical protein S4CHLAM102_09490 [Chlamydiia bacterium]|nr:hypothetical protein [Chlamydiia bacterium]
MQADIEKVLEDLIAYQQKRVMKEAESIIPNITAEDVLQPFDYPELEMSPTFRYEEGVLAGMLAAQTALRSKV